jgi:hypothetical protein
MAEAYSFASIWRKIFEEKFNNKAEEKFGS